METAIRIGPGCAQPLQKLEALIQAVGSLADRVKFVRRVVFNNWKNFSLNLVLRKTEYLALADTSGGGWWCSASS